MFSLSSVFQLIMEWMPRLWHGIEERISLVLRVRFQIKAAWISPSTMHYWTSRKWITRQWPNAYNKTDCTMKQKLAHILVGEANIMFLPQLTFLLTIYGTWLASSRTSKRGSSTTRPSLSGKATRMVLGQAHWIVQTSWKFTQLGTTVQRNLMYAPLYHPPARPKQVSAHAFPLKCVKESSPVNIRRITMYHNRKNSWFCECTTN